MRIFEFLLLWVVTWIFSVMIAGLFLKLYDPAWPRWRRRAFLIVSIPFLGLGTTMIGVDERVWDVAMDNFKDQWS